MSVEHARGACLDEIGLSGEAGCTAAELWAHVQRREPASPALPPETCAGLWRFLRRCPLVSVRAPPGARQPSRAEWARWELDELEPTHRSPPAFLVGERALIRRSLGVPPLELLGGGHDWQMIVAIGARRNTGLLQMHAHTAAGIKRDQVYLPIQRLIHLGLVCATQVNVATDSGPRAGRAPRAHRAAKGKRRRREEEEGEEEERGEEEDGEEEEAERAVGPARAVGSGNAPAAGDAARAPQAGVGVGVSAGVRHTQTNELRLRRFARLSAPQHLPSSAQLVARLLAMARFALRCPLGAVPEQTVRDALGLKGKPGLERWKRVLDTAVQTGSICRTSIIFGAMADNDADVRAGAADGGAPVGGGGCAKGGKRKSKEVPVQCLEWRGADAPPVDADGGAANGCADGARGQRPRPLQPLLGNVDGGDDGGDEGWRVAALRPLRPEQYGHGLPFNMAPRATALALIVAAGPSGLPTTALRDRLGVDHKRARAMQRELASVG